MSTFANEIPGMNSLAGLHDVYQVNLDIMQGTSDGLLRTVGNVPAMGPATVINYTAVSNDYVDLYFIEKGTR